MLKMQRHLSGVLSQPKWITFVFSLVCLLTSVNSVSGSPASAAVEGAAENQIKAAMLYKFLGYTEWPATAFGGEQSSYRIWVLGASHIADELHAITANRRINDRPVEVHKAKSSKFITEPHIVFVGRGAERYLPALAKLAEQQSFLIVTENEQGLEGNSAINLRLVDGRIGFDVSLPEVQRCHLKLSARLLSVASTVKQGTR